MKTKLILIIGLFLLLLPVSLLLAYGYNSSQHADYGWGVRLTGRTYIESHPRVVIDRAHHNAHTARGKYHPFATLIDMDGCDVKSGKRSFSARSLEKVDVLVIVNASGGGHPTLMGINVPLVGGKDNRAAVAFTPEEIEAVRAWVEKGGSLLLIADHNAYHVGQVVYLAKLWAGDRWGSLSIPIGQSAAFNAKLAASKEAYSATAYLEKRQA